MAARAYGDANENGNTSADNNINSVDYYDHNKPTNKSSSNTRRSTKQNVSCSNQPHHGFVFKAFTKDSVINIKKRKSSKAKKNSATFIQDQSKPKLEPDPYLASGQQLPPALARQLPKELIGRPIEDIDPYYADQETFVIISRGKELTRFSAAESLYFFGPFHPIRRVALYILVNPIFNLLVILTILINCILMTLKGSDTEEKTEIFFTIVYTTEMCLKVLARGFIVDKFTYLRDPWNWLDFTVILMAYLTIVVQDLGNLSVMRTFRVLRALKTVAIIPGMKTIVGAVIDSVKNLKDVVVLTLFSLSVFSLLGLQIYMGQLTQKCILNGPINMNDTEWRNWCSNKSHWIPEPDDEIFGAYRLCGNASGAQTCPENHTCLQGFGDNPDYGFTNFDTFGWALICSFRLMTQDFWEGLYMQILKTAGSWHIIFFIVSIFLGSIYLMNLILAIVAMSYNELQRRAEEEEEAAAEDEAAFLESCRLMEFQEQISDYSTSTQGGRKTSYRPSVEIGLVGQSLLASLVQNGLLGRHVREKLNQQVFMPNLTDNNTAQGEGLSGTSQASASGPGNRSYSLSVNIEALDNSREGKERGQQQRILSSAGDNNNVIKRKQSSVVPMTMASSMTELSRRKSSTRFSIDSNHHKNVFAPTATQLITTTPVSPTKLMQQLKYNNNNNYKLSPHYVSSSVLPIKHHKHHQHDKQRQEPYYKSEEQTFWQTSQQTIGDNSGFVGRRSARSSTTSDRDLSILRQKAALIRIVSDNCCTSPKTFSINTTLETTTTTLNDHQNKTITTTITPPPTSQTTTLLSPEGHDWGGTKSLDFLKKSIQKDGGSSSNNSSANTSKRTSVVSAQSNNDSPKYLNVNSSNLASRFRTKSHDYSSRRLEVENNNNNHRYSLAIDNNDNNSISYNVERRELFDKKQTIMARASFGSEATICKQPKSIHQYPQIIDSDPKRWSPLEDTHSNSSNNNRVYFRNKRNSDSDSSHEQQHQQSLLNVTGKRKSIFASTKQNIQPTTANRSMLGGSTNTLHSIPVQRIQQQQLQHQQQLASQTPPARMSISNGAKSTGNLNATTTKQLFGESQTTALKRYSNLQPYQSRMHHLSVENFQQFGCQPLRPSGSMSFASGGSGSGSVSGPPAHVGALKQPRHQLSMESSAGEQSMATSGEFPLEPTQPRFGRGRLESRGHIHPSVMMRSSFARPRQSIVGGVGLNTGLPGLNGQSSIQAPSARRISQDFVRRASDWSRLSMSGNTDLRRLLRLWAHTNPYQGRPSVCSYQSQYSNQAADQHNQYFDNNNARYGSINGSPAHSPVAGNSPRPSSVGSTRHAYELISAFNRRHNRYAGMQPPYPYGPDNSGYALPLDDNMVDKLSINGRDKCIAYCLSCLDILCIWECCGVWLKIQKLIGLIVFDPFTELFIILCILINTLFMALDSDDADSQMKIIFERGNYFFTATFAVEASMKIMALSPKFYFREGWNVFDSIIVGLSLLELGLEGVYGLSVLRSFRLLRVFKLAKSWPTLNLLISIMGKAVGDLGNLTFVLAIIVFIFAVMGMQLFGNKYVAHNFPSNELPRWNFIDFFHSFMIVFRILCAEWIEPMWDCLLVGGWPCIPFFLMAVTVGNLVVLNLFLALLLASFGASNLSSPQADNVDTRKLQEAIARFSRFGAWIKKKFLYIFRTYVLCGFRHKNRQANSNRMMARGSDGNYYYHPASADGSGRICVKQVKSHIAAMSKLERMKNIELRTEELKSKIRRSPEHHYHLKQLAQLQLKESHSLSGIPSCQQNKTGFNYHYQNRPQTAMSADQMLMAPIPIIVNEAADVDCESTDLPEILNSDVAIDTGPIDNNQNNYSPSSQSSNLSHEGEDNNDMPELYHSKLKEALQHQTNNSNNNQIISSSGKSHNLPAAPAAVAPRFSVHSSNMQPIKEDSRDADSSASLTELELASKNTSTLDKLAQKEISLSRLKLTQQLPQTADRNDFSHLSEQELDEVAVSEKLLHEYNTVSHSPPPANKQSLPFEIIGSKSDTFVHKNNEEMREQQHEIEHLEVEEEPEEEEERPKSSLYLKAPKRQDMEEDDEKTLQHIETYIEKCICLGILCLKWFLFRQYVRKIVEHRYFDQCILILIVISSGTLALEDKHLNERPTLKRTLDVLDTIFTIIFSLEMIFKWLAFGIKRYFGNIWSWLDFVIVLVSLINLMASIFGSGKIQALKTMRTLRAMRGLRPLRALQRFQGMRVVVNALIQAIPSIFNVLLVCLIFWLIFSIMGVQMFGGKFWRCIDPITKKVVSFEEAANKYECLDRNLTWSNPQINFDNVLNAYLALFQVATFKGWIDIMNSATDSRARDDQPIREANIYMYFYFVFFVIFGSFFTLNLFIGVIIDNFNEQKKKTGGSLEIFMTDDQKKYYHAMKKMRSKRPQKAMTRPKLKFQAYMFDITTSKKFDMTIMLIIGLNMFVMALEHYGQSQEFSIFLENLNLLFIAIFTLECLCKIFAMRHFYFREPWNIFDFIVVNISILGVVMKEYVAKYFVSPTLLRVVRVVKVGRVLRLVKGAKGIRTLLFALAMSLPALFNICLLLFLVMFIYAIFGMSFFMNVRKRNGLDETFNFETFTSSIIVLFQMSTSAAWDIVLDPLMDEENDCQKPDPALGIEGTCGNKVISICYLISYVILTFLIIINMYIAVILENYSQATEDVQEGLTEDDYEMYYEIWQKFDPNGTQYLPYEKLSDFVDALEDPLRIPKPNELALVVMDINIYEGNQCYCVDILDALTKYFFTRKGLVIQVNEHLQKVQSTLHETPFERITTTYLLKREHYCARMIQNCWRKWRNNVRKENQTQEHQQQQHEHDEHHQEVL